MLLRLMVMMPPSPLLLLLSLRVLSLLSLVWSWLAVDQGGGKTRSLLIGINYVGQQGELAGCHNDVAMMKAYIGTHVSCTKGTWLLLSTRPNSLLPWPPRSFGDAFVDYAYVRYQGLSCFVVILCFRGAKRLCTCLRFLLLPFGFALLSCPKQSLPLEIDGSHKRG